MSVFFHQFLPKCLRVHAVLCNALDGERALALSSLYIVRHTDVYCKCVELSHLQIRVFGRELNGLKFEKNGNIYGDFNPCTDTVAYNSE